MGEGNFVVVPVVYAPSGAGPHSETVTVDWYDPATGTLVAPWAASTAYVAGDRVENDTPLKNYIAVMGGTSDTAGGPTGSGTNIADNTVIWNYLGDTPTINSPTMTISSE